MRRIALRRGRYNIPNVGIFLWRIADHELAGSPAVKLVPGDPNDRRYFFSPLGANAPLFSHAIAEDTITHIAERTNVPAPITRRELWNEVDTFYPSSLAILVGNTALPASAVAASDLSDAGAGWAYSSSEKVLIDPLLGRLSLPSSLTVDGKPVTMTDPEVTFHYGFPGDIGGGDYTREATFNHDIKPVVSVSAPAKISDALAGLPASGAVVVRGNRRYPETLAIAAPGGAQIEIRADESARPTVELAGELVIDLADDSTVTFNGLLLLGARLRVPATARRGRLLLRHCTLVPGIRVNVDGTPQQPTMPSLVVESDLVTVEIDHSVVGGLRAHEDATVRIEASIIDATDPTGIAYAAPDNSGAGGEITVVASTVIGKVHARVLKLVSNSILAARLSDSDTWTFPIHAERRQEGCVRFTYVPPGSRTPRRYECQPASASDALRVQPQFTSERYGDPVYCQLSGRCAVEIRTGADDESEMGAFHDLYGPQRETNLTVRLEEYLRFGLEAGIFHAS